MEEHMAENTVVAVEEDDLPYVVNHIHVHLSFWKLLSCASFDISPDVYWASST